MEVSRTRVGIIGAGPAGLFLGHLLHRAGIDSVILEARSREHVEHRIRAGVLEPGTVDAMIEAGVGDGVTARGLVHDGLVLRFGGRSHRIDLRALAGRGVTIYAQHEVVRDLIAARVATGRPLAFGAPVTAITGADTDAPVIHYRLGGRDRELVCDVVAGCDGSHGVARAAIPAHLVRHVVHEYPFAWLGILAEAPPSSPELVYASHDRGFALLSMRSPAISRLYLQCAPGEDLAAWPDARIWDELEARLADPGAGFALTRGPIVDRGVTAMRSEVLEPMRYGRLALAGDAAHIVPPTGAKGLNLAIADARHLAGALAALLGRGDPAPFDAYSAACLHRVWEVQRFARWMTALLHRDPAAGELAHRLQRAELEHLVASRAAATALAESYLGLSIERAAPALRTGRALTEVVSGGPSARLAAGAPMLDPPYDVPAYRSTALRAPRRPLIPLATATEARGPAPRLDRIVDDLTREHADRGEPIGQRIVVSGRITDADGHPIPHGVVELWQANAAGRYAHPIDQHPAPLDPCFTGAGRARTDADGRYRFVTIAPGAYPWRNHPNAWRPAHLHFSVFGPTYGARLITQMYFPGDPLLALDPIYQAVSPGARERLIASFDLATTIPEVALGYRFDLVLGGWRGTPADPEEAP